MAEAVFFTSKRTLECSICLQMYNLKNRIPKTLRCGHSFCESCLESLKCESFIRCPKDRRDSAADDLVTCFAVTDILDTLCEDCSSQEKSVKCYHCDNTICAKCLEKHAPSYHSDLRSELDGLQNIIFNSSRASTNATTYLEFEEKKAQTTIEQIRQAAKRKRSSLDQMEKDLEEEVRMVKKHNTEQCVKWETQLEQQIIEAKQFHKQSDQTLGTTYTPVCTMDIMYNMHQECNTISGAVLNSKHKKPLVTAYNFIDTPDSSKLIKPGKIMLSGQAEAIVLYKVPQASGQSADIYRIARFYCMTGNYGSGPGDFDTPMDVTSIDDRLIVTDKGNDRIKIYEHNLYLLHVHGTQGWGPESFHEPVGVTVNADHEILVTDSLNNRIIVLTKYCETKYCFGNCRGTKKNIHTCIGSPTGMCVDKDGKLFVCVREEYENRVKVLAKDGTVLCNIGASDTKFDQLKNSPVNVAIHKGKLLISDEVSESLSVFTTSGQYLHSFPNNFPDAMSNRAGPNGIAVDRDNNIIYADHAGYLVVLNQQGEFVCTIGSPGDKPGQFRQPEGVHITKQGHIVVCDTGNHRVQIFKVG